MTKMRRTLALFAAHITAWTALILIVPGNDRVDFSQLGDAATPWMRQFVVALAVVLAIQVTFITRQGWWSEVLGDQPRSARWWMWVPPILVLVSALARFGSDGLSDAPTAYWIGMTITMGLVGVTEELTFRGILVTGFRHEWGSERKALLLSSALFGLFHFPNWWLGQELGITLRQVIFTAVMGAAFYSFRRATGSLVACMVLHAVYDWLLIQGAFA